MARLLTADFLTSPQFKLNSLKLGSHFLSTSLIIRGQNYIISIRDQANKFLNACHSRLNGSIMQLSEQQMASRFLQSMGKTSVKKFCRCWSARYSLRSTIWWSNGKMRSMVALAINKLRQSLKRPKNFPRFLMEVRFWFTGCSIPDVTFRRQWRSRETHRTDPSKLKSQQMKSQLLMEHWFTRDKYFKILSLCQMVG